ncbi:hypothetical protein ACOSP7_016104 [Xanthoceras sorbifolium]
METEKVVSETEELPKTIVRRVVKDKLHDCSPDTDISVHKDALLAFSESARIFIHYVSATANDICKESKRQTINGEDVLKAIEEIDFPELLGPLRASLDEFRQKNAGKRAGASKSKEEKKKQKVEKEPSEKSGKSKKDKVNKENDD